ncbi:putative trans-1,2-dihydrobenzene-1,2-diol dehydrogenase [Phytophthora cinnamomi]|uniref:putative trans-1,2-dihydrobenzene-1,2-diol dehydrogenase n=1 Tax=Phytophthora cinnamomi TaxID=4785 RepID=UPI00355999FB|nr:putative trans-1,2-dihydrobenzene-1,2-diol dehydrogenase [Phytophthora cinnamomi]
MSSIDKTSLRWGILGCGRISHTFASNVKPLETAIFHACAARSLDKAEEFAKKHGIPHAYDSYEALCSNADVDVVYIGTIHPSHCDLALMALNHGKHVLVEKPMAMNAKEAEAVIKLAQQKKLFFMEGMWARFFPAIRFVRQLIDEGEIGDVHHVHSAFGVPFKEDNDRIWKKELGGGGLLDIGIYVLASATMVFGFEPEKVTSAGKLSDEGVDVYNSITLEYSGQRFATVEYSTLARISETVTITGSKGRIFIHPPAHATMEISVVTYDENGQEKEKTSRFPWPTPTDHHSGFLYEAQAVTEAIQSNRIETSEYPHAESLGIMKIMDQVRHDLGLAYAADSVP